MSLSFQNHMWPCRSRQAYQCAGGACHLQLIDVSNHAVIDLKMKVGCELDQVML